LEDIDLVRSSPSKIPKPSIVDPKDISTNDLSNILAVHLGMDGSIYAINSTYPVPIWRFCDYITGFSSSTYDLEGVKAKLETIPWVKNIKVIAVPYYNAGSSGSHALEFIYRVPADKMKKICDKKGQWRNSHAGHMGIITGIDLFGVKKFQLPERKETRRDEPEEN